MYLFRSVLLGDDKPGGSRLPVNSNLDKRHREKRSFLGGLVLARYPPRENYDRRKTTMGKEFTGRTVSFHPRIIFIVNLPRGIPLSTTNGERIFIDRLATKASRVARAATYACPLLGVEFFKFPGHRDLRIRTNHGFTWVSRVSSIHLTRNEIQFVRLSRCNVVE